MSLILEALRKSEAERRRGQAPDLFAEPATRVEKRSQPRSAWPGPLVAVLVLVSAVWAVREYWWQPAPTAPITATLGEDSVATVDTADAMTNAAPRFEMPGSAPVGAPIGAPTAPTARPPAPVADAVPVQTPQPLPAPVPEPMPVSVAPPATVAPAPDAPEPVASPPAGDAPLRLADLSPSERASLPALRLSMHVWKDDPGARFAIVDGNRLAEGARVGDAVVQEITRDGLVLAWQGRRVHVPRP